MGSLLRAANGEESGLTGVPPGVCKCPSMRQMLLTQWGYPTSMDALSADEWEQRISANAMQLNPLDLLGGIDGSTTDGTRSGAIVRIRR